jgi:MarR family transcriptional regulator, transcriptional regulator for hemolysin
MSADVTETGRASITGLRDAVRQLLGAERRLRRRSQGVENEFGYAELLTLAVLGRHSGRTASEVARLAGLDPGSLTAVLDRLEAAGAIERSRNPTNRRAYVISLTAHGRDRAAPSLQRWVSLWEDRLAGFTDKELVAAAKVVTALSEVFDSVPQCDSEPEPRT